MKNLILMIFLFCSSFMAVADVIDFIDHDDIPLLAMRAQERVPFTKDKDNKIVEIRAIRICTYMGYDEVADFELENISPRTYVKEVFNEYIETSLESPVKVLFRKVSPKSFKWINCL